jgi:hypothetical protein
MFAEDLEKKVIFNNCLGATTNLIRNEATRNLGATFFNEQKHSHNECNEYHFGGEKSSIEESESGTY